MNRQYYLYLADSGLRMPVASDLVLREKEDAEAILEDGERLGRVIAEAARRYATPLAFPVMDLQLEKRTLLDTLGVDPDAIPSFHFQTAPDEAVLTRLQTGLKQPFTPRLQAHIDAVRYIARETELMPIGMSIGPFSLATKLLADPITPIFLSGSGLTAEDDPEIKMLEAVLRLALTMIEHSVRAQIKAGAEAIFIAEPAANAVYFSPRQLESGADTFKRYVMEPNRRIMQMLRAAEVDLIFHCCGELVDSMVQQFAALRPVILSLGSSRKLWEDAVLVPDDIVLYGNLPTKKFYSDNEITCAEVEQLAADITARMQATDHPFILGSECDVLSVPGCHDTIKEKVDAFLHCTCGQHHPAHDPWAALLKPVAAVAP